jgi:hypothetical protein
VNAQLKQESLHTSKFCALIENKESALFYSVLQALTGTVSVTMCHRPCVTVMDCSNYTASPPVISHFFDNLFRIITDYKSWRSKFLPAEKINAKFVSVKQILV